MQLIPLSPGFSRYLVGVQYIGSRYSGWQGNASQPSIQGTLEESCHKLFGEERPLQNLHGSSRTDAGVHAMRNTFQIDLPNRKFQKPFTEQELCFAWNHFLLGEQIAISDAQLMNADFCIRKHTLQRTYMYRLFHRDTESRRRSFGYSNLFHRDTAWFIHQALDIQAMRDASSHLVGQHDFSTFRNARCQAPTPCRNITSITIDEESEYSPISRRQCLFDDYRLVTISVSANAFLYRMVRNIVAVLVQIGLRKRPPSDMKDILEARDRNFIHKISPAPPQGLFLFNVEHDMQYAIEQGSRSVTE